MDDYHIAIVDGTGAWDDADYAAAMKHSFCSQVRDQVGGSGDYQRGPSDDGYRMLERGHRAADFLAMRGGRNLMLAGYSRGGSAVILAAEALTRRNIRVAAMFLFDPVARHMSKGGEIIPANVERVWIARRRLDRDLVEKYDHTIGPLKLIAHNPMRVFFGTTGDRYLGSGPLVVESFRGSHGAVGGVGWTHVTEDAACQTAVATFMTNAFASVRLPVALQAYPPSSMP
ncbi:hypothetical protein [Sphingomonas sp. dw_22]|uniref:hypothetical protein n=1 Tax=Sphingomonas sp. dw_22 TaxID=2721175 RepID=UPI001BD4D5DA|nr:hypothetical protein [Sphingomonas sp. dw_22]